MGAVGVFSGRSILDSVILLLYTVPDLLASIRHAVAQNTDPESRNPDL
jgi:hypothetical protein